MKRLGRALRVLIVEDSEDDALLLLRELRRGGYEPEYERVDTPEAMKEALTGSSWDVIISDCLMPRFRAPEALTILRGSGLEAPFIVVSGKVGEDVAVEMMKAGAHDYVMKDNLARLCTTVERGLEEVRERRERRRVEEELRGSEERYRAILDNATAVVYVKDKEGRYLLTNRRYEELFHVSREQVMGKTDHDLFSKEAADEFRANDERVLRLGTPLELEEAAPQDDGLHTYISVKFPLRGPDGVPYALCGISTDITERKRAEAELTREREFLTAMLDSLKEGIVACNAGGT